MEIKVEDLTIEEKIGQKIMIGMDTTNVIDKIGRIILKYKLGGVLLYKKNFKTYKELVDLNNYIKEINSSNKVPIFIAIDQEGGRVNRLPSDFKNIPSAYELAKEKQINLVGQAAKVTGKILKKTGFNMDFSPVLDIKRFKEDHAIGDRAFSENVEEVEKFGIEYMKNLQEQGIISVIKHFPGHGATTIDSHFIIPRIKTDIEQLEKEDMSPFKKAIIEGADSVLVGHLNIQRLSGIYPVSMSKSFIDEYLREKLQFKGVVITDDMRMRGVKFLYGKNLPVQKAFEAGNDIILFKYDQNDEKLINSIVNKVESSKQLQERIDESVKRILELKEKYRVNDKKITFNSNFPNEINNEIDEIKGAN